MVKDIAILAGVIDGFEIKFSTRLIVSRFKWGRMINDNDWERFGGGKLDSNILHQKQQQQPPTIPLSPPMIH